jgi:transcriptional regulator with GAF, ATPase, and Fis domain
MSADTPRDGQGLPPRSAALERLLSKDGAAAAPSPAPAPTSPASPPPESTSPAGDWELERLRGQLREAQARLAELDPIAASYGRLIDLLEANAEVLVAGDAGGLPARVLAIGLELVGAERAAFFRPDKDGALRPVLTLPEGAEFSAISRSVVRDALVGRESVVHQGKVAREGLERQSILDLELETVVATPLVVRDRLLGVLYLDGSRAGRFGRADLPVLEVFSRLAAAAMLRLEELERARAASAELADENRELRNALGERTCIRGILAASPAMLRVLEQVRRMSRYDSTVRITGETGTGKDLIARALHLEGRRAEQPFVAINCAAIPETLLEAELFGHEKGSFTGADSQRRGLFEQASGGTLFLDEIGDMPAALQGKLLRVLEDRKVRRIGGQGEVAVDVRIITASHADLEQRVRAGSFREDLFYRLNVLAIELPPLRERPEDVAVLTEHFLDYYAKQLGLPRPRLAAAALRRLQREPWPGNVRQLEKCIERSLALSEGGSLLGDEDLALDGRPADPIAALAAGPGGETLKSLLLRVEKEKVARTLTECGGRVTAAAERLGISRQHLHKRLRDLGLRQPDGDLGR